MLQKSEAFQSVHHVIFILCYNVLSVFGSPLPLFVPLRSVQGRCPSDILWSSLRYGRCKADIHWMSCTLVFSVIRVRKLIWEDITQGKQ
ncbi:hypothetical protein DWX30_05920 [Dorea formicigenerans]|uniref:Uncharacterized protein n=1 Tax=Dorea formicigenerans TaxID=39486 RepID=A0A413VXD0_9FIRM|nr:hypothetical protein DWX30_05920 [Dorea formicigenerans]RHB38230.1 hypothetical protein DW885_11295 [Dorea formicigenerans]